MATTSKDAPRKQAKRFANKSLKAIRRQYHIKTPKGQRGGRR